MRPRTLSRQDTIDDILRLMPPRSSDRNAARENLRNAPDDELDRLRSSLIAVVEKFGADAVDNSTASDLSERRAAARIKMARGFNKLISAGKKIEIFDRTSVKQTEKIVENELISEIRSDSDVWNMPSFVIQTKSQSHHILNTNLREIELNTSKDIVEAGAAKGNFEPVTEGTRRFVAYQIAAQLTESKIIETDPNALTDFLQIILGDAVFEKYIDVQVKKIARDIMNMLIQDKFSTHLPWLENFRNVKISSQAASPTFIADSPELVSETDVIDGFAKMATLYEEYKPDHVIVISGGGQIVGSLLKEVSGGYAPFVFGPSRELLPKLRNNHPHKILVVDDISRTGLTMARLIERCHQTFLGSTVRGMALVGTIQSDKLLRGTAFFPNLSPIVTVRLPWDTSGEYRKSLKDHILGFGKSNCFKLSKDLLDRSIIRMKQFDDVHN